MTLALKLVWPPKLQQPDLDGGGLFSRVFGFTTSLRTGDKLQLRATDPGAPCVLIRAGGWSRFVGAAFPAADSNDLLRLAAEKGHAAVRLSESLDGIAVVLVDPSGTGPTCGKCPPPRTSSASTLGRESRGDLLKAANDKGNQRLTSAIVAARLDVMSQPDALEATPRVLGPTVRSAHGSGRGSLQHAAEDKKS